MRAHTRHVPYLRQRFTIQPRSHQQVPRFLSGHGRLPVSHGGLEQRFESCLILGRNEAEANVGDLGHWLSLPAAFGLGSPSCLERSRHLAETRGLRLLNRCRRRQGSRLGRGLRQSRPERIRRLLLLLLLLLELLLVLLRDRRHRRSGGGEVLLRRGLPVTRKLRLELSLAWRLQPRRLGLYSRIASVLLLEGSLPEAGRLGSERARLLLLLLLLLRLLLPGLLATHAERAAILLGARTQVVAASEVRVRVRIHGGAATRMGEREARRAGGERITWSAEGALERWWTKPASRCGLVNKLRVKNELVTKRLIGALQPSK